MSQENVEVVGMACEAWTRGDLDSVLDELFHEDLEWDTTHFRGWLESTVIRGRTEVRNFLVNDWLTPWDTYVAGIDALVAAGEDEVLAFWWQRMSGRESGIPVHLDSAQIWTLRDGQVLRIANYTNLLQALEAAGLSE